MIDRDLAELYGVETEHLKRQVRRNLKRFPEDFLLMITRKEYQHLIHHFGGSSWGGTRKLPFAFTEHGILMLSSVLNSERAVQVNILIMRTFINLRETLSLHKELAVKLRELERKVEKHDSDIHSLFEAIRLLMKEEEKPKNPIGFHVR